MKWLIEIKRKVKQQYQERYARKQLKGASLGKRIRVEPKLYVRNPRCIKIGDDCFIGHDCRIEAWDRYLDDKFDPSIVIENEVKINSTCHIGCINKVVIGEQTLLGSHVLIIDHSHGKNELEELSKHPSDRRLFSKGEIVIGKRCWICENAVILPGVHIGDETTIAANAVVTKDIPSRCVAAGNPARIVKKL